jgi:hypothetical protein
VPKKPKFHLLTEKEIEKLNQEFAGEWWHYYKYGEVTKGMRKYRFVKIINLCTEVKLVYMEDNNEHEMIVKTPEFINEFRRTEKEAWAMYVTWINKYIAQEEKSIARMQEIRRNIILEHLKIPD